MDPTVQTITTASGRQTKTPAKFSQAGSLGAAVGGGGLSSSSNNLLPGITGDSRDNSGGTAANNTQSEGGAGRPHQEAATQQDAAPPTVGKGKGKARSDPKLQAILSDPRFSSEGEEEGSGSESVNIDSEESSSSSSGEDDQDGTPPGEIRGGRPAAAGLGGAATGVKKAQSLQKSIERNRSRDYERWPVSLLKEACSLRKITGYSRSKDQVKIAKVLMDLDGVMDRPSPFLQDLDDKAAGDLMDGHERCFCAVPSLFHTRLQYAKACWLFYRISLGGVHKYIHVVYTPYHIQQDRSRVANAPKAAPTHTTQPRLNRPMLESPT